MPIIADPFTLTLSKDRERYLDLISGCQRDFVVPSDMGLLDAFVVRDVTVQGLEDLDLLLLVSANREIEYACYYSVASLVGMGKRVVQSEVRCDVPDLARAVMDMHFLTVYDSLRCSIATTAAGLKMWLKFYAEHCDKYSFFLADVCIDTSTKQGCHNQNPANAELYENLRPVTAEFFASSNTNRDNYVTVIYAVKKSEL